MKVYRYTDYIPGYCVSCDHYNAWNAVRCSICKHYI